MFFMTFAPVVGAAMALALGAFINSATTHALKSL